MSLLVYGGTFDPLHLAHLRLAWEALEQLGAETLSFLPSASPPHRGRPGASARQRADWIAQAISGVPGFRVDERELHRAGPSYSVLTLRELRAEIGPVRPLIWLIGEDALAGLPHWHEANALWTLAHFAVLKRPDQADRAMLQAREMHRCVPPATLLRSPAGKICWLDNTEIAYSATAVRARIAAGLSLRYLVDEGIRDSIEACSDYQASTC